MTRNRARTDFGTMIVFAAGALLAAMGTGCGSASKPFHLSETTTLRADADDLDRFELRGRVGDITVIGDPEATQVVAEVTKVGRGTTIAEAQTALEEIEVSLTSRDGVNDVIKAEVHHPRTSYTRAWEVDWKVTAPPDIALKLRAGVGDLVVKNFERDVAWVCVEQWGHEMCCEEKYWVPSKTTSTRCCHDRNAGRCPVCSTRASP